MDALAQFRSQLLADIESFVALEGVAETTFGKRAMNDGKFVDRLRAGDNMTERSLRRARSYLDAKRRVAA